MFWENSNETFNNLFLQLIVLHIRIKQLLNLHAVKFHTIAFFLGDIDDYIRTCSNFTCME